jgi:hypothetical protein
MRCQGGKEGQPHSSTLLSTAVRPSRAVLSIVSVKAKVKTRTKMGRLLMVLKSGEGEKKTDLTYLSVLSFLEQLG